MYGFRRVALIPSASTAAGSAAIFRDGNSNALMPIFMAGADLHTGFAAPCRSADGTIIDAELAFRSRYPQFEPL